MLFYCTTKKLKIMSYTLRLVLHEVFCNLESTGDSGDDYIYLLGFGMTKGGHGMTIAPFKVGDFVNGRSKSFQKQTVYVEANTWPTTDGLELAKHSVNTNEMSAMFVLYLAEKDEGNLVGDFNDKVNNKFWHNFDSNVSYLRSFGIDTTDGLAFMAFLNSINNGLDGFVNDAAQNHSLKPWKTDDDVFQNHKIYYGNSNNDRSKFIEDQFREIEFGDSLFGALSGKYTLRYNFHIKEDLVLHQ